MKLSLKKPASFKKEGLEISPPLVSLPFMFSVNFTDTQASTSSSDRKESESTKRYEKLKSSFKKELQKLGVSAKLIPEKNPLKESQSRNSSPSTGLPFQRRARSSSPPKEDLKVVDKKNLFAPRSPVIGSHKMKFREDFSGLCKDSGNFIVEEDEDLRRLKEDYRKMLEGARIDYCEESSDEIGDEGEVESIGSDFAFCKKRYF
jgi:hypothetical protein